MLLFDKSLTLCFDKLVVKDLLSLILLLLWFSDFSGSNFLVLKGDLLPEKLDLTCNATKLSLNIFLELIIIALAFSSLYFAINFAFS